MVKMIRCSVNLKYSHDYQHELYSGFLEYAKMGLKKDWKKDSKKYLTK